MREARGTLPRAPHSLRLAGQPATAFRASPSSLASVADISTTSRPPPSRGTRMTMPRPSLVTSSGPSPVLGFMAAMRHPLPRVTLKPRHRRHRARTFPGPPTALVVAQACARSVSGDHYRAPAVRDEMNPTSGTLAGEPSPARGAVREPVVKGRGQGGNVMTSAPEDVAG